MEANNNNLSRIAFRVPAAGVSSAATIDGGYDQSLAEYNLRFTVDGLVQMDITPTQVRFNKNGNATDIVFSGDTQYICRMVAASNRLQMRDGSLLQFTNPTSGVSGADGTVMGETGIDFVLKHNEQSGRIKIINRIGSCLEINDWREIMLPTFYGTDPVAASGETGAMWMFRDSDDGKVYMCYCDAGVIKKAEFT
jgi:hypothetical protein